MDKVDNKLMGLVVVFFLVFGLFAANVLFAPQIKQIRARNAIPSATKSALFSDVRTLTTNGTDKATLSVFIRADDERAIANVPVKITTSLGTVIPTETTSNENGISSFFFTCTSPGTAQLGILANGQAVGNQVSVVCQ
ncbi:hypothetical protein A3D80_02460 [Candidatus Roizmanbacteria bacterium RIFCSPHIGHO2_02_FULL_40_13b]|uniref:Invasin domain-containing protein n=1 Tax=Candidatus Roizmanbacteria bacterium RIFCSPHIGHO2_01_FULL_39_24 TaxID=1802032 RepID=A0A1F7GIU7_9BACT|nr:MAG: hypothetical protein A2799_01950 [Candidatus Roizmanbacteria bacterium RIFCSPHIGHO2_01_FULL_39_24]OGK26503.1 MAG: hypothetical protein A3D80_02460 [Candidatus Roizmanbacteria bacterium RIFCSPHIGHO2_02_FULL_40_13b]OGK50353.1 MAG: hypothetical protein A3A56_00225 [Candidatus Roizmanbacteria bacterium RIFCSPLOWO2_01_FULL_40_32]OGK56198.1 MAG: hypothetical protein A3H83_01620 [Candidatus Roizmanbacteria bacterium RIFCSPLOWO2_02_FULL_39_8]